MNKIVRVYDHTQNSRQQKAIHAQTCSSMSIINIWQLEKYEKNIYFHNVRYLSKTCHISHALFLKFSETYYKLLHGLKSV